MKVVHLTDLHVQTAPRPAELLSKRLLGSVNLYLLGRKSHFSRAAQEAAVAAALAERPDLVIITGDLTAQALDAEFEAARALLTPLLDRFPTLMIPGNHDTYVSEPSPGARMRRVLGAWMAAPGADLRTYGEVAVLCLESCRTHLLSSGRAPDEALGRAAALLNSQEGAPFTLLALHYPLRDRHGAAYGPATRALSNAAEVEALLQGTDRIGAVLHGHEHHGFRTTVASGRGEIPILNPGASGYAFLPDRDRTAHLNVYDLDQGGIQGLRRLRFDGRAFGPEPGGAYATGR